MFKKLFTVVQLLISSILLMCVCSCEDQGKEYQKLELQHSIENSNSLTKPIYMGTNELGEMVKRYEIYSPGAYGGVVFLYEIGDTKTTIIGHGKFGVETEVTK